jgi:Type II secretion system (T2SS), protein E, N-terminal domain
LAQRIGELLVSQGRISPEILSRALELQSFNEKGLRLGGILLKWGLLKEEEILEMLGRLHHCPFVGAKVLSSAEPDAVKLLSPQQAERLGAVPYALEDRAIKVAFVNPSDLAAVDEVSFITRKRVKPSVTMEVRLFQAQQKLYGLGIPTGVWGVLQRLERQSRKRETGPPKPAGLDLDAMSDTVPVSSPAPAALPDFSVPDEIEPALSADGPETNVEDAGESLSSARGVEVPVIVRAFQPEPNAEDPFSDQFSLRRFIEDAIEFFDGLPNLNSDILDEPVEDLDPEWVESSGSSRRNSSDLNSTAPSRSRLRSESSPSAYSF